MPEQFTNVTVRVYNRWGSLVYDRDQVGGDNWMGMEIIATNTSWHLLFYY